jgi:hypothetical protein
MPIQDTIFSLFGSGEKRSDTYRDSNGKGVLERFNECIGKDMDFLTVELESMAVRLNDIDKADFYMLTVICEGLGLPYQELYKGADIDVLRRIAKYSKGIIENRANKDGVKLITYLILPIVTVEVIEDFPISGFDSSITLDDSKRFFDTSGGLACVGLSFEFNSPIVLGDDEKETLRLIASFNTPIDCLSVVKLNNTII